MRLVVAGLALVLLAPTAQAYLDPGTASLVWQSAVAGLLGLAAALTNWWKRLGRAIARAWRKNEV